MSKSRSVLKRLLPDSVVPRNAFDRSFIQSYHYSAGQIIPIMLEPVIAGSHNKINRRIFQRTAKVNTAAFSLLDTHLQFYYVPMTQILTRWEDMKLNIQDVNSSQLAGVSPGSAITAPSGVPTVGMDAIKAVINSSGYKDSLGYSGLQGALRLLDMAGYGNYPNATLINDTVKVNLLGLCAYQKVYYDHFRNTAYESNDPFAYNLDYSYYQNSNTIATAQVQRILKLRYVNYRKDYFMNLYPSLDYVVSNPAGLDWSLPKSIVDDNHSLTTPIGGTIDGETESDAARWTNGDSETTSLDPTGKPKVVYRTSGTLARFNGDGDFQSITHNHDVFGDAEFPANQIVGVLNAQTIRATFALDKLMRSSAYAPKHAKQQYEARYGIKYPSSPNECSYIGSFKNDIAIGEVTQMVNTASTGSNLGEIGGKGVGSGDFQKNELTFNAPKDGFIVGVCYTLPRTSYDSCMIKNYNLKSDREDFFIPEFMNMGLQPITQRELCNKLTATGTPTPTQIQAALNVIKGFIPRYQEYKLGIDINHGLFGRPAASYGGYASSLSAFTVHSNDSTYISDYSDPQDGVDASFFKVKPSDLDSIMESAFDSTDLNTDQFLTWLRLSFVSVQNMSVHGQPRL